MITVSYRNVDNSQALSDFLQDKTLKLKRFLGQKIEANWVIDSDGKNFNPKLNIVTKGKVISLQSKASNAFVASGEILAKAKNLLSKNHVKKRRPKENL